MQPDSIQALQFTGRGTPRQPPSFGLPGRQFPPLTASVRDCLSRLLARQQVDAVEGLPLWLPRLGVTVLPHELVTGGWLCTLVAADAQPARLPVGVFVVDDVEVATAFAAEVSGQASGAVQAGLSAEEFRDVWLVRLAALDPRYRIMVALLDGLDLDTLTVTADEAARRRSTYRTVSAFGLALGRLCSMGFLVALDHPPDSAVVAGVATGARYGLRLPGARWSQ